MLPSSSQDGCTTEITWNDYIFSLVTVVPQQSKKRYITPTHLREPSNKIMRKVRNFIRSIGKIWEEEKFLSITESVETVVAKFLTIALLIVILVALVDLVFVLSDILVNSPPSGFFNQTILEVFGLFLNVLIALELLDNITAYLRKHIFQVELVIATSLIAVARKIIIFDLKKYSNTDLISLAVAIFALSISYWLVRRLNRNN